MTTLTFDTLAYSKRLRKAGVPEKQADAYVEALAGLVKKIHSTKPSIKYDFQESKFSSKKNLLEYKSNFGRNFMYLLLWVGAIIASTTLSTLIVKAL